MFPFTIAVLIACLDEGQPTSETIEDFTVLEEDAGEEEVLTEEPLDFIGSWEDNYGTMMDVTEEIISDSWGSIYEVSSFDNNLAWVTARNAANNTHYPDLWSKFQWYMGETELQYCHIAYQSENEEAALTLWADISDVVTGCNGSPWKIIRRQIEIMGSYTDNGGENHAVNAFTWTSGESTFVISTSNNEEGWAVAQNDSGNESNPGLWSKFEWHNTSDSLVYCQSASNAVDQIAAQAVIADKSDLDTGCDGRPWGILTTQ
jgi:hypothetical protein